MLYTSSSILPRLGKMLKQLAIVLDQQFIWFQYRNCIKSFEFRVLRSTYIVVHISYLKKNNILEKKKKRCKLANHAQNQRKNQHKNFIRKFWFPSRPGNQNSRNNFRAGKKVGIIVEPNFSDIFLPLFF